MEEKMEKIYLALMRLMYVFMLSLALSSAAHAQASPTAIFTNNVSATIATGNTFQTVLSATVNAYSRKSLTIQNNNSTDSCWIFIGSGSATKATSILLLAGGSYTRYYPYVPADAIQATCATTSDTLYVDYQ
jgi:hypothetical protein